MKIELVRLYDTYAPLLSERQKEVMNLYYNEDESLAEISENVGITRQGVRDCILKAENQLQAYENALGIVEKTENTVGMLEKLLTQVKQTHGCEEIAAKIEEIIENIV